MFSKFISKLVLNYIQRNPKPFQEITGPDTADVYMQRWCVIPKNNWINIYIHRVLRDDDDRALHDHPWNSLSLCCEGSLHEVTKDRTNVIMPGEWKYRKATYAHRLKLCPFQALNSTHYTFPVTLFITGPWKRKWGFHTDTGWVYWKDFLNIYYNHK